ncbi:MAG: type II/IV secretion system protein [Nitrospirae bacterium]|nr:type II/IV secretion system protein [Nitrospirota bacterium]
MDETTKKRILKILLAQNLIAKKQAEEIWSKEEHFRTRLIKAKGVTRKPLRLMQQEISLIDIIDSLQLKLPDDSSSLLTEELIMKAIAKNLNLPYLKIDPLKLDSDTVTKIISKPYALKHQIVTLNLSGTNLTLATSNPFDREGVDGIRQLKGFDIEIMVAPKSDIMKIITEFYGFKYSISAAQNELSSGADIGNLEQYVKLKSISEMGATDQHIINAVEYLLHYAYAQRASDIHIEPKREYSVIRFRIDGMLHAIHRMPKPVHSAFVSRIKTLARMDIAEKRRPQDGRIKTSQDGKEVELRVSTLPVSFGEKVVIRIFDPAILMQNIESLGFLEREIALFKSFIAAPYGLILVTGPTGSGKTTTLYSALRVLSTPDVNITTIEDPVEMIYEDFNQTSVQPQIGITFASSLRTLLRQDPDIIMVGEIRDMEAAENAIQAALTGHLVMSTLHTNDAPSSITRLLDIGVPSFLINTTLIGVIAQRLVRKVCPHCAEWYHLSEDECTLLGMAREKAKTIKVSIGAGCPQCRGTGYLGRTAVFEIMEITDKVRATIEERTTPTKLKKIAQSEGFTTLRENAIRILLKGITTVDEVVRVTGISSPGETA